MTFISYAQNREDVLLHRLFKDQAEGRYIDIGAYDPTHCSITRHFYDKGWSGINVEPDPSSFERVRKGRPRDINVNMGISNHTGSLTFYRFSPEASGLCTFCREEAVLRSEQGYPFVEMRVQVTSLAALCEAHVHSAIDFLTIDVEGHEEAVISGADWKRYRPRVIVIESTRPLTTCPSYQSWEAFLVKHAYLYATFDGLNRFYVAEEHREDVEILQVPPNVLDDFLPYDLILRQEALESRLRMDYEDRLQAAEAAVLDYRRMTFNLLEPFRKWRERRREGGKAARHRS